MAEFTPTTDNAQARIIRSALADLNVSAPGTVESFDATNYTVDVKLGVLRPVPNWDGSVGYEEIPILPAVPVATFGSTRTFNRPDLQKGDVVWVIFAGISPAEFLETGDVSQPGDTSRFSLSGGLAIPITLPGKLPASPKCVLGGSGADFVALATKTNDRIKALEDWAKTHTHTSGGSGSPTTGPVEPLSNGSSVAAAETKAL